MFVAQSVSVQLMAVRIVTPARLARSIRELGTAPARRLLSWELEQEEHGGDALVIQLLGAIAAHEQARPAERWDDQTEDLPGVAAQ